MVTGRLRGPVLNIHTIADQFVPVEQENWYAQKVAQAGQGSLLRQAYVQATGHCAFEPMQTVAALQTLEAVPGSCWGVNLVYSPTVARHSAVHLANLDLNLLVTLRELLRERNVTRAAARLGVSQPAVSASLARLRRHFGDQLLVRTKNGYSLSALATQLADQVETICAATERLFGTGHDFNPGASRREFTLLMADYTIEVLGGRLSTLLAERAPGVHLHIRLVREAFASDIANTIRLIDGMVAPPVSRFDLPEVRSVELFTDRWVCVADAANPRLGEGALSLEQLAVMPWVLPFQPDRGFPPAAPMIRQLVLFGIQPWIAVRVESYQAVPHFVAGTERVALLQERLAARVAGPLGLRVFPCPGEPEPIVERFWWHADYDGDPAHRWLRDSLVALTAGV